LFPGDSIDTDTILKHSNIALFHAKAQGHNNFLFYNENLSKNSRENMKLESDLRRAVEDEQFELYYQPKVDLVSGKITGMEALLRWHHPEVGMIPPDEFIPITEATGLITVIGKWVIRTACNQIRAWDDAGYKDITISINLSAVQFRQDDLLQQISEILDETGVAPHRLELEITENTIMDDIESATTTLRELHKTGVQISIDDFGTGYSSLSYLKRFPINTVKIDRAFIRDITTDTHDAAIVRAVMTMAHNMGLRVVAEGIETVAQLDYLRELQCDEIQGYLFSPPVPYREAETMLEDGAGFSHYLKNEERAVS
ncbi:MAG: EAL domain-containing protein, partial [Gammaproteobacteria bacterium]